MSKRSVGFLLALILAVAAGTLIQDFRFDGLLSHERAVARSVDYDLGVMAQSVTELRATQASYVATSQTSTSSLTRANELFERIGRAIDVRKAGAPNADTRAKYEAVSQSLATLAAIDTRARTALTQEDRLHAADLVTIDAEVPTNTLLTELSTARILEDSAAAARIQRWNTYRLAMNGLALLVVVLVALYFGRSLMILAEAPPASTFQMLRDLPPPVKPAAAHQAPVPHAHVAPGPPPKPVVSLTAAAELCGDLARVLDGRDVPALLERTATLLEAKGLVLWAADTSGAMLRPSLTHGYSEKIVSRLRPLQVDGDNVTALAYRSLEAQSLPGATSADPAALAVPLVTGSGCVGVLSAEVRQSRPHPDLVQVARIVAAQFSTLVAPMDDAVPKAAQG